MKAGACCRQASRAAHLSLPHLFLVRLPCVLACCHPQPAGQINTGWSGPLTHQVDDAPVTCRAQAVLCRLPSLLQSLRTTNRQSGPSARSLAVRIDTL